MIWKQLEFNMKIQTGALVPLICFLGNWITLTFLQRDKWEPRIVRPAVHTPSPTLAISPHIIFLLHLNRTWILLCINYHLLIDEGDDYFTWTTSVDPLDIFILIISSPAWNPLMNQSYCLQSKDQYINKNRIWHNLLQISFPVSTCTPSSHSFILIVSNGHCLLTQQLHISVCFYWECLCPLLFI